MKREPFFRGYRPQFYFRTEENKREVEARKGLLLPKAFDPFAITQATAGGRIESTPAPKEGSS
ncbi:hypothetical protein NYE33_20360 [Paenibacillus sp. FSL R10-2199]|uniref:hypothetical protein n=1 Tax=Paenibacillus sp. FSL R10-2199 TaxID=2975348 RepID=UPI0030F895BC